MKISLNWLRHYLKTPLDEKELSLILTESGLEVEAVEKVESVKGGLRGVVVAHVLTCEKHPGSDHLSLTTLDTGTGHPLPVVCGAPNVAAGQKVLLATVGTTLYFKGEPLVIKKAKIRGAESEGMICAEDELGIGTSHDGIMVLDPEAPVGMPAATYLGLKEDTVFEIGLTPNRTDATSHYGVARDLAASIRIRKPGVEARLVRPAVDAFTIHHQDLNIEVEIENPEACPRYSGITLSGVKVSESPAWLKELLLAAGIRPINNVVDITNFVLMETGQPLHAFDAAQIKGNKIVVRTAPEGTPFVTLDGITRTLSASDLMICNARDEMCIAGVFGGLHSGVTDSTTSIFLESACFAPGFIRKTSRRHQLFTDASFRFERGSDPEITLYALKRAALLLCEITGATVASEIKDEYPGPVKPAGVTLRFSQVERLTGKNIPPATLREILELLEYTIAAENTEHLVVQVPTCRVDVTREADVIEDILRIYGYNNIAFSEELHTALSYSPHPDPDRVQWEVAGMLVAAGFTEVMNNSLSTSRYYGLWDETARQGLVPIVNPLSRELDIMRADLLPGLLENIAFNLNRRASGIKIFEFGKVYRFNHQTDPSTEVTTRYPETRQLAIAVCGPREEESWEKDTRSADFYFAHAQLRKIMQRMGLPVNQLKYGELNDPFCAQGIQLMLKKQPLAQVKRVSGEMCAQFEIRQDVSVAILNWDIALEWSRQQKIVFSEMPRYPEVRRDLALLIDKNITFDELARIAYQSENRLLKQVGLFDIYEGEKTGPGKKSYALSFILQDSEKTLTEEIIDKVMDKLSKAFATQTGAQIR